MRFSKGFTLIELLIVIAIILILIAIALPNFLEAQIRAKVTKSQGEIRSLGIAIESFRIEHRVLLVDFWDESKDPIVSRERLLRWNFCSPLNFDDTVRNQRCILGNLTTPVAYIKQIPDDPFFGTVNETSARLNEVLAGTYFYGDNDEQIEDPDHNFEAYQSPFAEFLRFRPLRPGNWILVGMGPDTIAEEADDARRRGFPYSPTNGTRSRGDIVNRS
jgi:prepilin-type N-terminal cleavage/methylation domain-containing protein